MTPIRFVQRLRVAPTKPGVYMMKDRKDGILYIGKASNIKARLSSYFGSSTTHTPKIERMLSHLFDFDFTVTSSASEALMLENTLIKKHRPKFNVRLKDDKTYPYKMPLERSVNIDNELDLKLAKLLMNKQK